MGQFWAEKRFRYHLEADPWVPKNESENFAYSVFVREGEAVQLVSRCDEYALAVEISREIASHEGTFAHVDLQEGSRQIRTWTRILLSERERNGRDDSDWFGEFVIVDSGGEHFLATWLTGTTRAANALNIAPNVALTEEAFQVACHLKQAQFETKFREEQTRQVFEPNPQDLQRGTRVILQANIRNRPRVEVSCPCEKCNGSGAWVHPRIKTDVRQCFACKGTGSKIRLVAGKHGWESFKKGLAGVTRYEPQTFHVPCTHQLVRADYSVQIDLDDGRTVRTRITNIRLEREPDLEEAKKRAALEMHFWRKIVSRRVRQVS